MVTRPEETERRLLDETEKKRQRRDLRRGEKKVRRGDQFLVNNRLASGRRRGPPGKIATSPTRGRRRKGRKSVLKSLREGKGEEEGTRVSSIIGKLEGENRSIRSSQERKEKRRLILSRSQLGRGKREVASRFLLYGGAATWDVKKKGRGKEEGKQEDCLSGEKKE